MLMTDAVRDYEVGRIYDRRRSIHARFGGQRQGGISTPANTSVVFLFTGESGEQFGYKDGWDEEHQVFRYTGEGQRGDMKFVRGNLAIRDHAKNGRDLLLFQSLGKGRGCRYLGQFGCGSYQMQKGPDLDGAEREVIIFDLVPVVDQFHSSDDDEADASLQNLTLSELRKRAYAAANPQPQLGRKGAPRSYLERSNAVREYVLGRADGRCESCGRAAPFRRPNNSFYLEPHHIRRLTDGGPDHPAGVAAVCPNCHREAHHGAQRKKLNAMLLERIAIREKELEHSTIRGSSQSQQTERS